MIPPVGTGKELPEATGMGAPIQVPHIHRSAGLPWSHSSTPLIVQPPDEFVHVSTVLLVLVGTPEVIAAFVNVHADPPDVYPLPLGSSTIVVEAFGTLEPSRRLIPVVEAVATWFKMAFKSELPWELSSAAAQSPGPHRRRSGHDGDRDGAAGDPSLVRRPAMIVLLGAAPALHCRVGVAAVHGEILRTTRITRDQQHGKTP